jgi:hypothetical protein
VGRAESGQRGVEGGGQCWLIWRQGGRPPCNQAACLLQPSRHARINNTYTSSTRAAPAPSPSRDQVVEEGYEFFAKRQLVTIFSAPNYCGEFENAGAMMSVDETLMCSFQVRSFEVYGAAAGA